MLLTLYSVSKTSSFFKYKNCIQFTKLIHVGGNREMDQLYTTSQVSNGPIIHNVTRVKWTNYTQRHKCQMDQLYTTSQVSNGPIIHNVTSVK